MHSSVSLTHCGSYYEQNRNPEQLLMSVMGINNGARPVVCNCVGGVSVGSAGHSPSLPNEGNTTLPHTSTLHSHLQSQAPLPVSITPSAIDILAVEHCQDTITIYSVYRETILQLMLCVILFTLLVIAQWADLQIGQCFTKNKCHHISNARRGFSFVYKIFMEIAVQMTFYTNNKLVIQKSIF